MNLDLYAVLAIAAGIVALLVAGFGIFAVYAAFADRSGFFRSAMRRWTVFDYFLLALFLFGTVFLLADVSAVLRDRGDYPYYHYGYLLSGFVYNTLAGVFLFVRLGLALRALGQDQKDAPQEEQKPAEAEEQAAKESS